MEFDDASQSAVDPEVRAYVYSLVSAVGSSFYCVKVMVGLIINPSLEGLGRTKKVTTSSETMHLLVSRTSRDG